MHPSSVRIELSHGTLAGLRSGDGGTAGLIIGLHGGGYDANYWHSGDEDGASLLTLGAMLGFDVVAIDRPGYRGSGGEGWPLGQQAEMVFDLIDRIAPNGDRPVFLIGHSMGGILALMMAAHPRGKSLAAIDVSGVPLRYPQEMQPIIDRAAAGVLGEVPDLGDEARRWMFYGDDGTYDPAVAVRAPGNHKVPFAEMPDAFGAPMNLPPLMAAIAIPVQWTIGDQERSSMGGAGMLDEIRTLLPKCPRLLTSLQRASGHNISLHHVARAYHLRALAFFDECRVTSHT